MTFEPVATAPPIVHNIDVLVQLARARGLPAGTQQAIDLVSAVSHIGLASPTRFRFAARGLLVSDRRQQQAFDSAFATWLQLLAARSSTGTQDDADEQDSQRVVGKTSASVGSSDQEHDGGPLAAGGATWSARLRDLDIAFLSADEAEAVLAGFASMQVQESLRRSHRYVQRTRGSRVDLRRSLRAAGRTGGEVMRVCELARGDRPRPLVIVLDGSGSMRSYAPVLLAFASMLARRRTNCEVFVHSTKLRRVTDQLRKADAGAAMVSVVQSVRDWGGGTRLGSALAELNRSWGGRLVRNRATVALLTDGLDAGGEEELAREIIRLSRSCDRLLWLDPLSGIVGNRPNQRALGRLLDRLDGQVPAHNLAALEAAVKTLTGSRLPAQSFLHSRPSR